MHIEHNNNSSHGKFDRFLFPFSSKFPDLNSAPYVLYIYSCYETRTWHKQWAWVTCGYRPRRMLKRTNTQFQRLLSLCNSNKYNIGVTMLKLKLWYVILNLVFLIPGAYTRSLLIQSPSYSAFRRSLRSECGWFISKTQSHARNGNKHLVSPILHGCHLLLKNNVAAIIENNQVYRWHFHPSLNNAPRRKITVAHRYHDNFFFS